MKWKQTCLGVPLTQKSGHPKTICMNWPMAELRRISALCSSNSAYESNRQMMIKRLRRNGYSMDVLDNMSRYYPWLGRKTPKNKNQVQKIRFVTSYHPTVAKKIQKTMRECTRDVVMRETLTLAYGRHHPFEIDVAFRNVAKSVCKRVV